MYVWFVGLNLGWGDGIMVWRSGFGFVRLGWFLMTIQEKEAIWHVQVDQARLVLGATF